MARTVSRIEFPVVDPQNGKTLGRRHRWTTDPEVVAELDVQGFKAKSFSEAELSKLSAADAFKCGEPIADDVADEARLRELVPPADAEAAVAAKEVRIKTGTKPKDGSETIKVR